VSDGCCESIRQLEESIAAHDSAIPHIVVLNHGRLNGLDFFYLDDIPEYQAIKQHPNFITAIEIPALASSIQFFIDEHELTLESAPKPVADEMGILAGQRIYYFMEKCTEAFDGALETLERCWELPDTNHQEQPEVQSESPSEERNHTNDSETSNEPDIEAASESDESESAADPESRIFL